uniref:Uncharacterized protein n=1 Tax=Anopheles merus TaxID=30066 RepID=A0A453Z221_ANOME
MDIVVLVALKICFILFLIGGYYIARFIKQRRMGNTGNSDAGNSGTRIFSARCSTRTGCTAVQSLGFCATLGEPYNSSSS